MNGSTTLLGELRTTGRLSRGAFLLRHVVALPLLLWATIAAGASPGPPYDLPLALLTTLFLISVWGRRLHDRGRSAWWLLAVLVPVVGALGLIVGCFFLRSRASGDRFGSPAGLRAHYRVVA
jgi:uncharacterized membrane protein YhaH (DUF805 family)